MNEKTGIFGATYLRISRDKGENEDTLQNHRELMEEFCAEHNYTFDLYEEIVSGGKRSLDARPELQRLINNIGRYQAIFAVSLDRLSRNGLVSQLIKKACSDHDIKIITPAQTFDLANSEADRLLYDVSSFFATLEYEMMSHRNKLNKIQRARRGEYAIGKPAYGYRRNPETRRLEIHEPEAEVIRYIFRLYQEGYGIRQIADILKRSDYKLEKTNTFWPSTIRGILHNPVYKGSVVFHSYKRIRENGEYRIKVIDKIITEHAHPAIIQPEEWEQINRKRAQPGARSRITREKPAGKTGITMLKDLLFCGVCGRKLVIRREKHGIHTIKPCGYELADGMEKCYNRGIRLKFLEEEVVSKIRTYKQRLAIDLQHVLQQEHEQISAGLLGVLDGIAAQQQQIEQQQSKLLQLAPSGIFSHEELVTKRQSLKEEAQQLLNTRERVLQQIRDLEERPDLTDRLLDTIQLLEEFQYQTAEEQNETLKTFVKRIRYMRTMPEEIRNLSTRNPQRQAVPFSYVIEYF
jgi:DNA invertase Pin-like site-specific DNA recombinase/ribosomal protein L37AE/L43A